MEESAFRMFLVEYKKRLPDTEENKEFIEMIDNMIDYLKTDYIFYQERWGEQISPDDPRYWRNPSQEEKEIIEMRKQKQEKERKGGLLGRFFN
ncbi:MAG: hypothetical protein WC525_10135 [Candidatus Thermoplasmatota archaeon]